MQDKTICILLAGGVGSRLYPLTADRAKPAVPFGGRYRIIDFTLSNCLHSGLRRILVFTVDESERIIDKNVRIPAGETIGLDPVKDAERFTISERGIVAVPRGYRFES